MNFANLGFFEIMLILVVVLLLFGAKRLPEIGSSFGKSISAFKRGLSDANSSIKDEYRQSLPPTPGEPIRQEGEAQPEPKRLIS